MAHYLGVEIKDDAIEFLYAKGAWRQLRILEREQLKLNEGIICRGIIEEEDKLRRRVEQLIAKRKWHPQATGILIPNQWVVRREVCMPRFMEPHLEAYLASHHEDWMDDQLQKYLFIAHRIDLVQEQDIENEAYLCIERESRGLRRKASKSVALRRKESNKRTMGRYCLVGTLKEALLRPYSIFQDLRCHPVYISTCLDVSAAILASSEVQKDNIILVESKVSWHLGIYEKDVCLLTQTIDKERDLILEMNKLIHFYATTHLESDIDKLYIFWDENIDLEVEKTIHEAFDMEVISRNGKEVLLGLIHRLQTHACKRGVV